MKYASILFLGLFAFAACNAPQNQKAELVKLIKSTEDKIYSNDQPLIMNMNLVDSLIDHYERYASTYEEDTAAPVYLFKAANLYRNTDRHEASVVIYDKIFNNYPNFEDKAQCLFLQAFVYENGLGDLNKAKSLYEKFLAEYPEDEFAKSAQYSLKNLGKPIEEIIKEFEAQEANEEASVE